MNDTKKFRWMVLPMAVALLLAGPMAAADVVTDWNVTAALLPISRSPPDCRHRLRTGH